MDKITVVENQWMDLRGGVVASFANEEVARYVWEVFSQSPVETDQLLKVAGRVWN
jgi:hypothetical protein